MSKLKTLPTTGINCEYIIGPGEKSEHTYCLWIPPEPATHQIPEDMSTLTVKHAWLDDCQKRFGLKHLQYQGHKPDLGFIWSVAL